MYKKKAADNTVRVLLTLAISNLVAIFEVYYKSYLNSDFEDCNVLMTRIAKKIGAVPNLIPDHPDVAGEIVIKPRPFN